LPLTKDELERYSRQIVLRNFGEEGQLKVKSARVCVMGLGGLGSVSSLQLAGMGVGHLRVLDRDIVDITNLQRQLIYDVNSLGYPKVEIAAKKLESLNPSVKVEPIATSLNEANAESYVKGMDVVVDAFDRFSSRFAVNKACVKLKVPYVFGGAIETYGNATTIIPGKTACLECLFHNADDSITPTCERVGVIPPIINIIASIQVSETLRLILKQEPLLANKILYCDLNSMSFDIFNIARRTNCTTCGASAPGKKATAAELGTSESRGSSATELCGKESFIVTPNQQSSIDIQAAGKALSKKFKVKLAASYGLTLDFNERISVSLMKGGNMLIKGANTNEEAQGIFNEIMRQIQNKA
jgi:molybdopterin/thiamine biosynthesis adenylyltransferase